jgi:hypothetical protein
MTDAGRDDDKHMREQRLQRNLKILVVGLGILILMALAAVVVGIITQSGKNAQVGQPTTTIPLSSGGTIAFELPIGAKIISISLSGNRLAVHYEGQEGTGIAILDVETGQRVLDVKPTVSVPKT